jgi:hypothetical protein
VELRKIRVLNGLRKGVLMNWEWRVFIDDTGECRWIDGVKITDAGLMAAVRESRRLAQLVGTLAEHGVMVGAA